MVGIIVILSAIPAVIVGYGLFEIDNVFVLMGIWAAYMLPVLFVCSKIEQKKINERNTLLNAAVSATRYRFDRGTLYIDKRSSLAANLLVVRDLELNFVKYVPEKVHIGAATVGSVTSGGVYTTGGYNQLLSGKSKKHKLFYLQWDDSIKQFKEYEVERIELSSGLASLAKNSAIKEYMDGNSIKVVDEIKSSPAFVHLMSMGRTSDAMNVRQLDKEDAYPTGEKCNAILQWICTEE